MLQHSCKTEKNFKQATHEIGALGRVFCVQDILIRGLLQKIIYFTEEKFTIVHMSH